MCNLIYFLEILDTKAKTARKNLKPLQTTQKLNVKFQSFRPYRIHTSRGRIRVSASHIFQKNK